MNPFGRVTDNAQAIEEMPGDSEGDGPQAFTYPDAIDNTTKAITMGIALATVVPALFAVSGSPRTRPNPRTTRLPEPDAVSAASPVQRGRQRAPLIRLAVRRSWCMSTRLRCGALHRVRRPWASSVRA
jgi:hypothetical protein